MYFYKTKKFPYLFLLPFFLIFSYFLLFPAHYYQIRHLIPIYGICAITLVYPFQKKGIEYIPILFVFYFFSLLFPGKEISSIRYFLIIFIIFTASFLIIKKKPIFFFPFSFFLIIYLFAYLLPIASSLYDENKFKIWKLFYKENADIWEFVGKKNNKNICYVGEFLLYPFFGDDFSNNIYYQSVNSIDTKPVHFYKGKIVFPKENPTKICRKNPSYKLWFSGLIKRKIDFIIIKKDKKYIEEIWVEENPSIFKKVFSSSIADVFEIIQ